MYDRELDRFVGRLESSLEDWVETENPASQEESGLDLEVTGSDFRLRLGSDEEMNSLVVQDIDVNDPGQAQVLAQACAGLAKDLECGSVLLPDQVPAESRIEEIGYRRQFYLLLAQGLPGTPSSKKILEHRFCSRLASVASELLSRDVVWKISADRRPYIFSLDFDGPEFRCYIHFHEITGSMYVEKLEVPRDIRGHGIGTRIVRQLKRISAQTGFGCIYLVAKKEAERFWSNQDFEYVFRLNLRNLRRRELAIRKKPGWDRTYVNGRRLPEPHWCYRNHPQDDIDFCGGLAVWTGEQLDGCDTRQQVGQ